MDNVYVLYVSHKYGHDLSLYATHELAQAALVNYVKEHWVQWFDPDVKQPEAEDKLIDMYFEKTQKSPFNDEWYDIDPMPVIGASEE